MAASRFVNVSDEDIPQFVEENENSLTYKYLMNKRSYVKSQKSF